MNRLAPYTVGGGWDAQALLELSDDSLTQLLLDNLPPSLLAEIFRAALSSPLGAAMAQAVVPVPEAAPDGGDGRPPGPDDPAGVSNPVAPFLLAPLRVASMTAAQVRAHAAATAAAARTADGAARRALLDLSDRFVALAEQRASDRAAMFRERSGLGSVALMPADLDAAESLKQRVRRLMQRTLAGQGDGFLLDADGLWHPHQNGDCPRPAFGPFGTEILGYQVQQGAPGFYLDPRAHPDERSRLRDIILADMDARIDHALRVRRHRGDDARPWPRVWSAEEIVAALSVPAGYRLSRSRPEVTVPL